MKSEKIKTISRDSLSNMLIKEINNDKPQSALTIQHLLQAGANPNVQNSNGKSLISIAAKKKQWEIIHIILTHAKFPIHQKIMGDALWDAIDANNETSLMVAKKLINMGAKLDCKYSTNALKHTTPLSMAIDQNNLGLIQLLLEHGANPNIEAPHPREKHQPKSLLVYASENKCWGAINTILTHSTHHISADTMGAMLWDAINTHSQPSIAIAKKLINMGAKLDCKYFTNGLKPTTPLTMAIDQNNLGLIQLLLEHGANPNIEAPHPRKKHQSKSLLVYASENEYWEAINTILTYSTTHRISADTMGAMLWDAINTHSQPSIAIAKKLIALGANVNRACGKNHAAPLHLAIRRNDLELFKLLLANGADPNQRYKGKYDAITLANGLADKNNDYGFLLSAIDVLGNYQTYHNSINACVILYQLTKTKNTCFTHNVFNNIMTFLIPSKQAIGIDVNPASISRKVEKTRTEAVNNKLKPQITAKYKAIMAMSASSNNPSMNEAVNKLKEKAEEIFGQADQSSCAQDIFQEL